MAGNNQIQLLRGSRSNSTGKDTVSEALNTLLPGQPLYSKDENYLYIGGDEDGAVAPVTTDRIKKGTTYVKIQEDSNAIESDTSSLKADIHLVAKKSGYINLQGNVLVTPSSLDNGSNTGGLLLTNYLFANHVGTESSPIGDAYIKKLRSDEFTSLDKSDVTIIPSNSTSTASVPHITLSGTAPTIKIMGTITRDVALDIGTSNSPIDSLYAKYIETSTDGSINSNKIYPMKPHNGNIGSDTYPFNKMYVDDIYVGDTSKSINEELNEINDRLDELGFKQGNIKYSANTIGYVAQLGTIVYGCIWEGLLLNGEQSFTIDSLISPCPKSTSVGAIPCYPIASSTGNVVRVPCSINGNTITTNTGSSSYTSKSNADFYFWYDTNTNREYPTETP